jgi:small subunit ribosomal protein S2
VRSRWFLAEWIGGKLQLRGTPVSLPEDFVMASTLVQDLIEAGIHFGQRSSGWNPRMQPFIYGKRNGIHIIDIKETIKGLLLAKKLIAKSVAEGKDVCFVGTKRQAKSVLEGRVPDVKQHFVTERWLGGTLTNFRTIRQRLKRLDELDAIEAKDNFASYSKKMESMLKREQKKISRNLSGIRHMEKMPGIMVVVDVKSEMTALREAKKLGITTIALIDTDGDPELVDIVIPGNDDSMRSIDIIIRELCAAATEGRGERKAASPEDMGAAAAASGEAEAPAGGRPFRRSSRSQFRADGRSASAAPAGEAAGTPNA